MGRISGDQSSKAHLSFEDLTSTDVETINSEEEEDGCNNHGEVSISQGGSHSSPVS